MYAFHVLMDVMFALNKILVINVFQDITIIHNNSVLNVLLITAYHVLMIYATIAHLNSFFIPILVSCVHQAVPIVKEL